MINISMDYPDYDFIFLGDFCPVDSNENEKVTIGPKLQNLLFKSKHNVVNLECPLTNSKSKIAKTGPNLKADPNNVGLLKKFNINICNLANNHIKDYGIQGIIDTCSILESSNIKYVGLMGYNENNLLFIDIDGIQVALVSFTENEFSTNSSDGIAAIGLCPGEQFKQISEAKKNADLVIVQYHGGVELYSYPVPGQQKYCHFLIDAGADIILSHHSHTISGWETYNDKIIQYGLGNFYFPELSNGEFWFIGLAAAVKVLKKDELDFYLFKYDLTSHQIELMEDVEISQKLEKMNYIISDKKRIQNIWNQYCSETYLSTLKSLFRPSKFIRFGLKFGLFTKYMKKKADIYFLNLIRCESHREKIITTIEYINKDKKC